MALILDGNRVRDDIKNELKPRVAALAAQGRPPGLAVVLVGNNPASEIYVRNKIKACHDLGIYSESITPPDYDHHRGTAGDRRPVERAPRYRRHPGAASPAAAGGYQAHPAGGRARERRGRLPPVQCRQPGGGPAGAARLHARGHHRNPEAVRHPHRRQARGGGGAQRYRGQAGRHAAAARARHRHHLPFEDAGSRRRSAARPTSWWRPWGGRGHDHRGLHPAGRHRDRCGHQPHRKARRGGAHLPQFRRKAGGLR